MVDNAAAEHRAVFRRSKEGRQRRRRKQKLLIGNRRRLSSLRGLLVSGTANSGVVARCRRRGGRVQRTHQRRLFRRGDGAAAAARAGRRWSRLLWPDNRHGTFGLNPLACNGSIFMYTSALGGHVGAQMVAMEHELAMVFLRGRLQIMRDAAAECTTVNWLASSAMPNLQDAVGIRSSAESSAS